MEYYYTPAKNIDLEKSELTISGFEFTHLTRVLRKKSGDLITVTDGMRNIYSCKILRTEKEILRCAILNRDYNLSEPDINIHLYLSTLRNAARFEFAVEKAVELGAASIQTVITQFTVNKNSISKSKAERINKIIIGAMGQSQRCFLPEFRDTISLNEMIKNTTEDENKIVMYESVHSHNSSRGTDRKKILIMFHCLSDPREDSAKMKLIYWSKITGR